MSKRLIALLILVAILCGGGYWFYNWTQRGFIVIGDPAWPSIRTSSLSSISIMTETTAFALVSKKGEWFVADVSLRPVIKADNAKVEELLATIEKMPPLAHITRYSGAQGERYGLDSRKTGITLVGKDTWRLGFGGKGPQENTVYVRSSLQGDQIVLCDGRLERFIQRPESSYYDMQLITFAPDTIIKVEANGPATGTWEIAQDANGAGFSAPEKLLDYKVNAKRFDLLLQALTTVRGTAFVTEEIDSLPPVQMHYTVWQDGKTEPQQVYIYKSPAGDGKYMVQTSRHGKLVTLDKESVDKLAVDAFLLRERPVFSTDLSDVVRQRILVRSKDDVREYNAERLESGWYEATSSSVITGVDMIMWRLRELQYLAAPRTEQPASAELSATWQFFGKEQESPLAVLYFYTDTNLPAGQCWLKVLGEETFYPVDKQLLDDIMSRLPAPAKSE